MILRTNSQRELLLSGEKRRRESRRRGLSEFIKCDPRDMSAFLAGYEGPEFEADPNDAVLLAASPHWKTQAVAMESAWRVVSLLVGITLLHLVVLRVQQGWKRGAETAGSDDLPSWWRETLSLDLRALALYRIGLGAACLWDVLVQTYYVRALRTDQGILGGYEPATAPHGHLVCLHCMHDGFKWQVLCMTLTAAALLAMMLGWRTTLATPLAWLMFGSMQEAGGMNLQQGADNIAQGLLFWSIFLPWGWCYSLDARRRFAAAAAVPPPPRQPPACVVLGMIGLMMTLCDLLWSCVLARTGADWNTDYTAVWNVFHNPSLAKPLGHAFAKHVWLCRLLTFASIKAEFWSPFFLFSGALLRGTVRGIACVLMIGFHAGLGSTIALGWFQIISLLPWVAFMPGHWIERLEAVAAARGGAALARLGALRLRRRGADAGERGAGACRQDGNGGGGSDDDEKNDDDTPILPTHVAARRSLTTAMPCMTVMAVPSIRSA